MAKIPFRFYHGTSTLHLQHFQIGASPVRWPYHMETLEFFRSTWDQLRQLNLEPDWFVQKMIDQDSGVSNWQHGCLYLTPSEPSAVRYAGTNAPFGGELLTFCKDASDQFTKRAPQLAAKALEQVPFLKPFFQGLGKPILIEIVDVEENELEAEVPSHSTPDLVRLLLDMDDDRRHLLGQQMNFRLKPNAGTIQQVYALEINDTNNPVSPYKKVSIL